MGCSRGRRKSREEKNRLSRLFRTEARERRWRGQKWAVDWFGG